MTRQTVSILQACALTGVCRRTIYNWMRWGRVEYKRVAGGSPRIYVESLWRGPHHERLPDDGALPMRLFLDGE